MRFTPNRAGLEEFLRSRGARAHLEHLGEQLAESVQDHAPERTGHFARSVEVLPIEETREGPRVTVHSTDIAAHIVEFGSANNPAYAPFRRAASALGLKLRGGGERR